MENSTKVTKGWIRLANGFKLWARQLLYIKYWNKTNSESAG
jgi:hypothetical protein